MSSDDRTDSSTTGLPERVALTSEDVMHNRHRVLDAPRLHDDHGRRPGGRSPAAQGLVEEKNARSRSSPSGQSLVSSGEETDINCGIPGPGGSEQS